MSETFSRQLSLDRVHHGERIDMAATDKERAAIARDLGLEGLDRLEAHAILDKDGETIRAAGRVQAVLTQACVVTGEPVAAAVDEPFTLIFSPNPPAAEPDSEIELGSEDCDVIFYDGAAIDLGQAVVDTLALAIDPFPRSAGADAALKEAGIMTEAEASPFAVLAALKGRESTD